MAFPEINKPIDGVYFDNVAGMAGEDFPIGTPGNPVNNVPDALGMMAARGLSKLYLVGTGPGHTITFDFDVSLELVGNPLYAIIIAAAAECNFNGDLIGAESLRSDSTVGFTVHGNCSVDTLENVNTGNIGIRGKLNIGGDLDNTGGNEINVISGSANVGGVIRNTTGFVNIQGNCYAGIIENTGIGRVSVLGNCQIEEYLLNSSGGDIEVDGHLEINNDVNAFSGYLNNTGGNAVFIGTGSQIAGEVTNSTGEIRIAGNLQANEITQTDAGRIIISGDCQLALTLSNTEGEIIVDGKLNLNNSRGNGNIINAGTKPVITIGDDCHITGYMTNGTGVIAIQGNLTMTIGDMRQTDVGEIIIRGNCQVSSFITNSSGGDITILGNLDINGDYETLALGYLDNTGGNVILVMGNVNVTGGILNSDGDIYIYGSCSVAVDITNSGTGLINIRGYCSVGSYLNNFGAGTIEIRGYCSVALDLTNNDAGGLGVVEIFGNVDVHGDVTNTGTLLINGTAQIIGTITNTGTLNYRGVYPETAVNITAIAASETDFLNLAAAGFHYTIDDLVLKCADPGVNTINVKLYKLVNGASTLVDTFAITTASFATYFNLMDMFGQPLLAGDNIKITVQCTGGGPYAVTGSYAYRSA